MSSSKHYFYLKKLNWNLQIKTFLKCLIYLHLVGIKIFVNIVGHNWLKLENS